MLAIENLKQQNRVFITEKEVPGEGDIELLPEQIYNSNSSYLNATLGGWLV